MSLHQFLVLIFWTVFEGVKILSDRYGPDRIIWCYRPLTEIVLVKIVSRISKLRVRFRVTVRFIISQFVVGYIQCIRTFDNMKRWCLVISFKHNFGFSLRRVFGWIFRSLFRRHFVFSRDFK